MYKYAFVNNSDESIAVNLRDIKPVIPPKGKLIFVLDDTSPVSLRVTMSQVKKVYNTPKAYILALRGVRATIGICRFEHEVVDSNNNPYVVKEKEPEVFVPIMKSIEITELNPVMHVGETQSVGIKTVGFSEDEKVKLKSLSTSVVRVTRNGKLNAQSVGDAVIEATIGDLTKKFAVEVLELKDLEG